MYILNQTNTNCVLTTVSLLHLRQSQHFGHATYKDNFVTQQLNSMKNTEA